MPSKLSTAGEEGGGADEGAEAAGVGVDLATGAGAEEVTGAAEETGADDGGVAFSAQLKHISNPQGWQFMEPLALRPHISQLQLLGVTFCNKWPFLHCNPGSTS